MDRITTALQEAIQKDLGLMSILMPQKAEGNTAQVQLSFTGIKASGESSNDDSTNGTESISLNATYVISGTHKKWINQAIKDRRKLCKLIEEDNGKMILVVKLDTENYRQRRKATLENLAKNIAFKVKRTKRPVSLEPMNPYERRIIHSALQNDRYVTTHSEGDEPFRRVVVTLKK